MKRGGEGVPGEGISRGGVPGVSPRGSSREGRERGGEVGGGGVPGRAERREVRGDVRRGVIERARVAVGGGGGARSRGCRVGRLSRVRVRGLPLRSGGRDHRDPGVGTVPSGRVRALRLSLQLREELLRVTPNLHRALRPDVRLYLAPRPAVQLERGEKSLVLLLGPPLAHLGDGVRLPDLSRDGRRRRARTVGPSVGTPREIRSGRKSGGHPNRVAVRPRGKSCRARARRNILLARARNSRRV